MTQSPLITGAGLVTVAGIDLELTWQRLLDGWFVRDHARVPMQTSGVRVNELALRAASGAVRQSGWIDEPSDTTALIVATSKGPVESWINAPPRADRFGLGETAVAIAEELHLTRGPRLTISAACASGLHALIRAVMMIQSGEVGRALVVAAESSLHPLFVGSFRRLGVLPAEGVGCRPFDEDRDGFLMTEAAAAVCLETSSDHSLKRAMACVERFALAGDAHHLTGVDPQGTTLRRILDHVVNRQPVDLIHAHGTGTAANDPMELAAIESIIAPNDPPPNLYSHKGALGHSLGAAGLVSIVINCISHRTGIIPPNVQTRRALPTQRVNISSRLVHRRVRRSTALAAGFGGPVAAVSLKSP